MTAFDVASKVGLVLMVFWAVKSVVIYYGTSEEFALNDFAGVVMIPWGATNATVEAARKRFMHPNFTSKQLHVRMHVLFSCFWAFALAFQLTPALRRSYINLHRLVGKVFLASAAISTIPLLMLVHNMTISPLMNVSEYPIPLFIAYSGYKGWVAVQAKDIAAHRSWMIMFAANFFYFGADRLVILATNIIFSKVKTIGGFDVDPATMTPDQYFDRVWGTGTVIAIFLVYGGAARVAWPEIFGVEPKPKLAVQKKVA